MIQTNTLDSRQSTLIKAMRFPLICLVVFAHSVGTFPTPTVEWSLDGWNIYHYVSEMLSRHLCSIGTCWFFVFSGYLFFRYLKDGEFSMDWVAAKWKKRVRSLLLPYLIWNALAVLAVVLVSFVLGKHDTIVGPPVYWFITGPADFPLWFLRDLMLLTLVTPLIYLFFKWFRWLSLVLLILVYLSPLNPAIPTMRSIFFFCIGCWLGIYRVNMISFCRSIKFLAAVVSLVLLLVATSQIGRPLHTFLLRLFYPFGMVCFMNICDSLIDNEKRCERLCALSGSVFFIYAAHEIYILGWTKGLLLRLFGESLAATWLRYFLVPVIVLGVCLALYWALNRMIPQTLSFVSGGRVKSDGATVTTYNK